MEDKVDLFIVGCIKGGTTWLYDVLSTSPNIYAPNLKEPHYFSKVQQLRRHIKHVNDFDEYQSLYEKGDGCKYRMDGSASYLFEKNTAKRIFDYNPNAKIIILLRHPVRRAFSHYQMLLREGVLIGDFDSVIRADYTEGKSLNEASCFIRMGEYYNQVKTYIDYFGSNVKILSYSDLLRSKSQFISDVANFIGTDYSEIKIKQEKSNPAALPKGSISRLILGNNALRYAVQKVLPRSFRVLIKNKYLLKKSSLKLDDNLIESIYKQYYKEDGEKLFELLGRRMWDGVKDI